MITFFEFCAPFKFPRNFRLPSVLPAVSPTREHMVSLVSEHGRLLVDRMEYRWITSHPVVIGVGRVARAVNCGLINAHLVPLTAEQIEQAASFSHRYEHKPYAETLTSTTAAVPLLAYRTNEGHLVLLDGRQRAVKALVLQNGRSATSTVKCYVVSQHDAFRVGQFLSETETRTLLEWIDDPEAADNFKIERDPYRLLKATRPRPVVFEGGERPTRSFVTALPISCTLSERRPGYDFRQERTVSFYRYISLELAILEEIVRRYEKERDLKVADAISMNISGIIRPGASVRDERRLAYDTFLRAQWDNIGLGGPNTQPSGHPAYKALARSKAGQYPSFATTDQNAARILRDVGFPGDVSELRRVLQLQTDGILDQEGKAGLLNRREQAVALFQLFAKAVVRMNQWETSKKVLRKIEDSNRSSSLSIGTIEIAARWDIDNKPSLVDFKSMVEFSIHCGVTATDIWKEFLKFDSILECCALQHFWQHKGQLAETAFNPSAIEEYVHRMQIADNGESDLISHWWTYARAQFEKLGLTGGFMIRWLAELDEKKQLDEFLFELPVETHAGNPK